MRPSRRSGLEGGESEREEGLAGAIPPLRAARRAGRCRGHRAARCAGCGLHVALCVCTEAPSLATASRVIVVTTRYEVTKSTTSTRLLARTLPECTVRIRGEDDPRPGLADPTRRAALLYPAAEAELLDAAWLAADPRPVTLVVPDGNWRQTRRMARPREPGLAALPRLRLAPGPPSRFRLRSHPDAARVSTLEAVARALEVLEGPERGPPLRAALERLFEMWVDRTLWSRGSLAADAVRGGLPDRRGAARA